MAQEPIENAKNEEEATTKPLKMQVLAQYIRDMSFENILAQKGISGEAPLTHSRGLSSPEFKYGDNNE